MAFADDFLRGVQIGQQVMSPVRKRKEAERTAQQKLLLAQQKAQEEAQKQALEEQQKQAGYQQLGQVLQKLPGYENILGGLSPEEIGIAKENKLLQDIFERSQKQKEAGGKAELLQALASGGDLSPEQYQLAAQFDMGKDVLSNLTQRKKAQIQAQKDAEAERYKQTMLAMRERALAGTESGRQASERARAESLALQKERLNLLKERGVDPLTAVLSGGYQLPQEKPAVPQFDSNSFAEAIRNNL